MLIDVRQSRRRIDVITNPHSAILALPSPIRKTVGIVFKQHLPYLFFAAFICSGGVTRITPCSSR